MSAKKIKLSVEPGHSYVVASAQVWEDLCYTITELANQWGEGSRERSLWVEYMRFFEAQFRANLVEAGYDEEDGWS